MKVLDSKICSTCGEDKSVFEFYKQNNSPDGVRYSCKTCMNLESKENEKKYIGRKNIERYGISIEQYNELLIRQDNLCAICKNPETHTAKGIIRRLNVDHCHSTGKVRGLLCTNCNTSLGGFKDNIDYLYSAIEYLEVKGSNEDS